MEIFGRSFLPGQKAYFSVDGPRYANQAISQIPVIVLRGGQDGPTLWVNGAVHGHEVSGSQGMWELANELDPQSLKGTIIMTPIANVSAFCERRMKSMVDDFADLDTQFPGSTTGLFASRLAKILYDEIKVHADLLISFHALTPGGEGQPYTIYKALQGADPAVNAAAEKFALAMGFPVNCKVQTAATGGSIDGCCIADGIPAFTAEVGRGAQITREMVDAAKQGLRNVLDEMGILPASQTPLAKEQIIVTQREFLRIDKAGFMVMSVQAGDTLPAGGEIAQVHYFGDSVHSFTTSRPCLVIFTTICPAVNEGDHVAMVAYEWHKR